MFMTENIQAALLSIPMELAKIAADLKVGLQETNRGQRITGARAVDVSDGKRLVWGGSGRVVGWSIRNVGAGNNVVVLLRDGRGTSGDVLASLQLGPAEGSTVWLGASGVSFGEALTLDVEAVDPLDVHGSVWLGAVD